MASLDELLTSLFGSLGPVGSLVILVIIFALDAALFPALPEVWIVVTYTYRPTEMLGPVAWAGLLLAMAVAGGGPRSRLLYLPVPPLVGPPPGEARRPVAAVEKKEGCLPV